LKGVTRDVLRFRGGLVFKAHRLVYHSTLGVRVIKKKKKEQLKGCNGLLSKNGSSQGQTLAMTILHVPSSLCSGFRVRDLALLDLHTNFFTRV